MLAGSAAAPALYSQAPPANNQPSPTSPAPPPANATTPPAPYNRTPGEAVETPKLDASVADDAAEMMPTFFRGDQYSALQKLSEIIMPSMKGAPGAVEAHVPEFLDFLLSQSPDDRKALYRTGLDLLNAGAKKQFGKAFSAVTAEEAGKLLAPLRDPWTYDPPKDPLAKFLRAAKQDIRTATTNSREYTSAVSGGGSRRGAGVGLYWYSLD